MGEIFDKIKALIQSHFSEELDLKNKILDINGKLSKFEEDLNSGQAKPNSNELSVLNQVKKDLTTKYNQVLENRDNLLHV